MYTCNFFLSNYNKFEYRLYGPHTGRVRKRPLGLHKLVLKMNLLFNVVIFFIFQSTSCSWAFWRRFKDGDYIVGALFPVTTGSNCSVLNEASVDLVEAFIYALNKVNTDHILLPNTSLGYEILDTCSDTSVALRQVVTLLAKKESANRSVTRKKKDVVAIIGPASSDSALITAGVLSTYNIPQASKFCVFASLLDS